MLFDDTMYLNNTERNRHMQVIAKKETEEMRRAKDELFKELDKGIRAMERGDMIPHEEAMRIICDELGLPYV